MSKVLYLQYKASEAQSQGHYAAYLATRTDDPKKRARWLADSDLLLAQSQALNSYVLRMLAQEEGQQ